MTRPTVHTVHNTLFKGHVEDLPHLSQGRRYHGCGSYYSGGTMVSMVVVLCLQQTLLVTISLDPGCGWWRRQFDMESRLHLLY
jgi:hypothetical protein